MFNSSFTLALKVMAGVVLTYVLLFLLGELITIILVVSAFVLYMIYVIVFKANRDLLLENDGKAYEYIGKVEKRYKEYPNLLLLHKSYGLFYQGKIEQSFELLRQVVFTDLKKTKHVFIYYHMMLKMDFEMKDINKYKEHLDGLYESGCLTLLNLSHDVYRAPLLLLKEKYQELWDLLMVLIPKSPRRYYIFELEYYLAICHINLDKKEDALAVLDFVSNKNIENVYVYKCQKLIEKIQ